MESRGAGLGHCWISISGMLVISAYISPNASRPEYEAFLISIDQTISRRGNRSVVIGGDFNAKEAVWGERRTDWRGSLVLDWATGAGLTCANRGRPPTLEREGAESIIDLTFAKGVAPSQWEVMDEDVTMSDHNCIRYKVDTSETPTAGKRPQPTGWAYRGISAANVRATVRCYLQRAGPRVADLVGDMQEACNEVLPRKGNGDGRKSDWWWNDEVDELHRTYSSLRRRAKRERRRNGGTVAETTKQASREARKELRQSIQASKKANWERINRELDGNPWGPAYVLARGRYGARPPPPPPQRGGNGPHSTGPVPGRSSDQLRGHTGPPGATLHPGGA